MQGGTDEQDREDMLRLAAGHDGGLSALMNRHGERLFHYLLRQLNNETEAADLAQESFVRVYQNAGRFRPDQRFSTWLYTIARNQCVDLSRRMKLRRMASLDQACDTGDGREGATLLDVVADGGAAPDRQTSDSELQGRLKSAIGELSEEQREVFLMREFLSMQFKEIAEVTGVPENTVKSRMRYALEKLRDLLEDYRELARAAP